MIGPELISEHLVLRTLDPEFITNDYIDWMNDPIINQFIESRFIRHTYDSVKTFVSTQNESVDTYLYGIFYKDNHIGNIKLGPIDPHHNTTYIGLLIGDKECWGLGFATEAISTLTEFAFSSLKLRKVLAGCYSDNIASYRAFIKSGYQQEAHLKKQRILNNGQPTDEYILARLPYDVTREDVPT